MKIRQIRDKRLRMVTVIILTFSIFIMATAAVFAQGLQGQTTRISVDSAGNQGNSSSLSSSISADGRFVAFVSLADNLGVGDTNGSNDIFAHNFLKLFSDVQFNNPFYNHVMKIVDAGITLGCGADTYCPANSVTRGQMSAFIIRAKEGEPTTGPPVATFTDVPLTHVFFRHVERMAALGITFGIGGGLYGPDLNVTRAEMASL